MTQKSHRNVPPASTGYPQQTPYPQGNPPAYMPAPQYGPVHAPMPQNGMPYGMYGINPRQLLMQVRPWVEYGLNEAKKTNIQHAMTEVALISYLMGMGYSPYAAHQMVESWEVHETFPKM